MKTLMAFIINLALASTALGANDANYYRVWQGFKKPSLAEGQFARELPGFMDFTVRLYTGVLSNYLVAIPPKEKPAFIPDEFALVALTSQEEYQAVRQTPEGQRYSEAHWTIFEKETSKSAPYVAGIANVPETLVHNHAYDVLGLPINWSVGHNTFFIGVRKAELSSQQFLADLSSHIKQVATHFKSKGLKGYVVIANDNYEVAYMNWESKEAMAETFASEIGKRMQQEAAAMMTSLQWSEAQIHPTGAPISENSYYTTIE